MIQVNLSYRGDDFPEQQQRFHPGQLVKHRRYGYRGVIVAADGHCKADPNWYMSNKTQPTRRQCWYHVLVHNSTTITYAAEENLTEDSSESPVMHPLVPVFFNHVADGQYVRNGKPWPETHL